MLSMLTNPCGYCCAESYVSHTLEVHLVEKEWNEAQATSMHCKTGILHIWGSIKLLTCS